MWPHLARMLALSCRSPAALGTLLGLALLADPRALQAQSEATSSASSEPRSPTPIAVQRSPQEVATQLIYRSLHQAVWGPPAFCTVRQQIQINDQQVSSFGKFIRAGKGSGKLKLHLQFPAGDSMNSLLQVSDGQILHTVVDLGNVSTRSIIDLSKIRDRLVITKETLSDPTIAMYLAIGGQAESLRKLSQQYEWYAVKAARYAEHDAWELSGRLAKVPPAIRALAETDSLLHAPNASGLLPTAIRVTIGKPTPEDPLGYWLYQVVGERPLSEVSPVGHANSVRHITEWADPQLIQSEVGPEVFEAASTNAPFSDETFRYLPPPLNLAAAPTAFDELQQTR